MTKKIKLKINARLLKKDSVNKDLAAKNIAVFAETMSKRALLDYKNSAFLKNFFTERGKILPARISGNCSLHQRGLSRDIRKSRVMALLPYSAGHF